MSTADQEQQGYQQGIDSADLFNTASQQGFANQATAGQYADTQHYLPLQTASALSSLSSGLNPTGTFAAVPQVQVDPSVDVYSSYQDQVAANSAANSTLGSLVGTLGGAGIMPFGGGLPGLFGIGSGVNNGLGGTFGANLASPGGQTLQSMGFVTPVNG